MSRGVGVRVRHPRRHPRHRLRPASRVIAVNLGGATARRHGHRHVDASTSSSSSSTTRAAAPSKGRSRTCPRARTFTGSERPDLQDQLRRRHGQRRRAHPGQRRGGKAVVLGGPDRIDTAILISKNSFPAAGSAQAVVLARADLFPDALAGAPLAVAKGGPLELTSLSGPTFIDPRTVTEIQRVLTPGKTIFVLGGTAAIADGVVQQLQALGLPGDPPRRHRPVPDGRADRPERSQQPDEPVPRERHQLPRRPLGGSLGRQGAGRDPADEQQPSCRRSPSSTSPAEPARRCSRWAVLRPRAAPQATPIVGADRYQTAVMAAQRFFTNPTAVGIASGVAFPDGLTGGAHIGKLGGPLLLTDPNALPGPRPDVPAEHQGHADAAVRLRRQRGSRNAVWSRRSTPQSPESSSLPG